MFYINRDTSKVIGYAKQAKENIEVEIMNLYSKPYKKSFRLGQAKYSHELYGKYLRIVDMIDNLCICFKNGNIVFIGGKTLEVLIHYSDAKESMFDRVYEFE